MSITQLKLTDADFNTVDVKSLPDRPSEAGISAASLKAVFDHVAEKVLAERLNGLLDALAGEDGAAEVGTAAIAGVAGLNVQAMLEAVKVLLDARYTKEEADALLEQKFDGANAVNLVKGIAFDEDTGVFTVTNYNGSTYTIDTALEKVALDVALEGQEFVLTLVDGTKQRVSLSAFITQTEFDDSTTVFFTVANGRVSGGVQAGSISLTHLAPQTIQALDDKKTAAANSAQAAAASAANSQTSATQAAASAQAAAASATAAAASANDAEESAQAALQHALAARADRQLAESAKTEADQAVLDAESEADRAETEANRAKREADRAASVSGGDFATNTQARELAQTAKTEAIAAAKAYTDKEILLHDAVTNKDYRWGIADGALYVEEVE